MAGIQPAKGWQQNKSPEQPSYYTSPTQGDLRPPGTTQSSPQERALSATRGRVAPFPNGVSLMLQPQVQLPGRALSPRVQQGNGESAGRTTGHMTGNADRHPPMSYGHHRQTSIVQGVSQHSRTPSYTNSPVLSHRSPQLPTGVSSQNGIETMASLSVDPPNHYPTMSPSTTSKPYLHNNSSTSSERDRFDLEANSITQKRIDRMPSGKAQRERGRSQSKHQPEQTSVGEYALHHLFNSFVGQADYKINQCVTISLAEPRVEDVCGPGVDSDFDQLITALGHIARQKPKPLIDTIMLWRQKKGEEANAAQDEMNQARNPVQVNRILPRRNTEPVSNLRAEAGKGTIGVEEASPTTHPDLFNNWRQASYRLLISNYLLCRVLIEVFHHCDVKSMTLPKLDEAIFAQLQRLEPDKVEKSPLHFSNWNIYGQLLGVMSASSFHGISHRFITILQSFQDDTGIKGSPIKESEGRVELILLAMRHLAIKTQPESTWKESCEMISILGKYFVNSHGQTVKHSYCRVFESLVFPIAAAPGAQLNSPKWKEVLNSLNSRLTQMLIKPRHWPEAFPLSAILLCASPVDVFAGQWFSVVSTLQAKLKDRMTRSCALQAICRLVWTYLHRTTEPVPIIMRKLEDVIKMVLPTSKKTNITTHPDFVEPILELIRIIGFRYQEFCFRVIIFPLINSDVFTSGRDIKNIKIEQLEPERMVIGIKAFLLVIADLENAESGGPSFPRFAIDSINARPLSDSPPTSSIRPGLRVRTVFNGQEERNSRPVMLSRLNDITKEFYARFCEILGNITLICDNAFGGQAALDEKFGGQTPKTPLSESFTFGRRDEHPAITEHNQSFYELLHVAVQALPRALSVHISFNSLINLLCTGTAHVQSAIAISSAKSLKAIARQSYAQQVTSGFARFIFKFDSRYSTMSDEGMLGPGHIESTLQLYLELLQIWIEEIKQKTKTAAIESPQEGSSAARGFHLDLTSISAVVEEVESHGVFFLCSQSRRVRSFAVSVLRLVTEFDTALGRDNPRIIQILDSDLKRIIDPTDDRLSVAERSRIQKEKRNSASHSTLIEICSSNVSYDSTLWLKLFPNLVRLSFELCPFAVTLGRENVCARLLQMDEIISSLAEGTNVPHSAAFDRALGRPGTTPPEVIIEQWKMYLIMACTTLTNAGAQTQSQLANTQHARNKSRGPQQGQDKITSARALFAYVIPLLPASPSSIRDAIVSALGSININLYRTLLESLQYAVTTCNEEAKLRVGTHQRTGSSPRKNRKTDRLRTEVTHVYKLTSRFLYEEHVLQDEWIVNNLIRYTDEMRIFLSDSGIQHDWEFQTLRRHYCGLMEEVFEAINRTKEPSRWMPFEARKAAFALMEDWCGYSPNQNQVSLRENSMRQTAIDQHRDTGESTNVTAAMEIEKHNLRTAALSAMASLCGGPISVVTDRGRGPSLSFDVRRMLSWIDQIFDTISDKMHLIGRRALLSLITHNTAYPKLLERAIDMCYVAERPKALESYFEVVSQVLIEHDDYDLAFWRILGAVLFTLGNENPQIRMKSAKLLRTLEQRQQKSSKLQDFDISISDKTTAVYKLAQFEISRRLAKQHSNLAFFVFSQFSQQYKSIHADHQRNMIAAILPWIQTIELQLDPNGGPTAQTHMLLANLLEITTKSSTALHNEVQALWQALATGPHGGNVQLILDFVINLCIERREQSFVDYAKQIVVFLSSTPAGQKVVEFLLLQITPKTMVYPDKPKRMEISPDVLGLPYIADLEEALPIGNKQSGFSLGQLSLILLVDLMVGPVKLAKESVPLLLQVCIVLWDHYTLLVQEQAREMLVHLIHELVISKIDDDKTVPKKDAIEDFIEAIRQSKAIVVWTYQESNGKHEDSQGSRVPAAMMHVTNEVIDLFSLAYPNIHEQWAKTTLSWATSCSVRHLACRSFQIFRCILKSLDQQMLGEMLNRLSNTISEEAPEVQTFSMEILTTLKTIIGALTPADLLKYPQLFWTICACLHTVNECEFIETLSMFEAFLEKVDLSDPAVIKILSDAKPPRWDGPFEGIVPLVYKGLKSGTSLHTSLSILSKTAHLPSSNLLGEQSRLLFCVLANLPCFLHSFDGPAAEKSITETAYVLATMAEADDHSEISIVLHAFANSRYKSSEDFLTQILDSVRSSFFPGQEVKSLIFLMGLLTNRLPWYKLKTMQILGVIVSEVNMLRSEVACHGPDLISPLLRLLQTEYCPQALEVMDHIMTVSATPMDKHHIRMSMASSGSRSMRKEYERTQSLYGIPEETGWSIPMPAAFHDLTQNNVRAVFASCASTTPAEAEAVETPEIEFDAEEFHQGSYFPEETSSTMTSEETQIDRDLENNMLDGDLVSKLDSLDDFFDDNILSDDKYLNRYSDVTITGSGPDLDNGTDLYDQQTAPILNKSLARTASVTSLHNTFTDIRGPSQLQDVMTPAAFSTAPHPAPQLRPPLHSRSVTSPSNSFGRPSGASVGEILSDEEIDEILSDDERSTGTTGPPMFEPMVRRTQTTAKKPKLGATGREYRQGDLLRGQSRARSKSQAPNSPKVPKVPEAFLQNVKSPLS